jgi:hypothetical protein
LFTASRPLSQGQEANMPRPKDSRKKPPAGANPIPVGVVVGHRLVIIRDGKFVRAPRAGGRR